MSMLISTAKKQNHQVSEATTQSKTNAIKIAVHSDLHTEFFGESFFYNDEPFIQLNTELDYLFLAGDIGNLNSLPSFFAQIRNKIPDLYNNVKKIKTKIIYVLGNHEHYGLQYPDSIELYRRICHDYNIHLLENDVFIDDENKVLIYGGTLWSDFGLGHDTLESKTWAKNNVGDYHCIRDNTTLHLKPSYSNSLDVLEDIMKPKNMITPDVTQNIFHQSIDCIKKWFTNPNYIDYKKITVTHFLPLKQCIHPKHTDYVKGAYWASHRPDIVALADVWIYGHSHDNINKEIDVLGKKVKMISNQMGYLGEHSLKSFSDLEQLDKSKPLSNGYQFNHMIEI